MKITKVFLDKLTYEINGAAIEVHKALGLDYWKKFTNVA